MKKKIMMNTYYRKYGYQRLGGQLSHSPTRAECQPSARALTSCQSRKKS